MSQGFIIKNYYKAGIAQLVEHHVANVNVAGSSPVSRSNEKNEGKRKLAFGV